MKDLKANTGWFNQINTDKIGVNTPTPTSDLHITGTAQVDGTLSIGDAVSLASSGAIGGTTPTVVGQTIVWDGSKWIVGNNNSGGDEAREVPAAFVAGLTNGQSVHTINFQETYTTPPAVSTDLQVTGTDPIIPYIITDVSNGSMTVEFAKALPSGNYKLHITFGGKDVYWDQGALDKLTYSDGDVNISNNLEVGGNLTISGETMTVNTTEMTIEDHNITIASNNPSSALTGPVLGGAGITWGNDDTTRLVYNHGSGFQFIGAGLQANEQFVLMSDVTNPALSAVTYQDLQSLPMLLKDSSLHNIDGTIVTGIGFGYQGETTSGIVVTDRGGSAAQSINFITGESNNVHNRLTVDWNGNIGIGTQTPTDRLSIVDGSIRLSGRPQFGGTPVTGDVLGTIGFEGVETSVNTTFQSEAKIQAIAEGNHSGDAAPTNLTFFTKSYTTGPGSQPSARMQINANGSMYVQDGKSIGWRYQVDGTHRGSISCDSSDNITFSNGPDAQKRVEIDRHGNLSVGVEHAASGALDVNSWGDKAPGTGSITNGNMTVPTTEDLTGIISAGDVIRFANDNNTSDTSTKEHTVIGVNSSPSSITLSEPATYTATLHIFKKKSTLSVVSGRVGIGTTDPGATLHVDGSVRASSAKLADLDIRSFTEGNDSEIVSLLPSTGVSKFGTIIETDPNGQMMFGIRGNDPGDAFTIITKKYTGSVSNEADRAYNHAAFCATGLGRVGIGTSNPGYGLHVYDTNARVETNSDYVYANSNQGLNVALTLRNNAPDDGGKAGNNVGMAFYNWSPGNNFTRFSYIASVQTQDNARYSNLVFGTDDGTGDREEKMCIHHSGRVGIGTPTPGAKLEIKGGTNGLPTTDVSADINVTSFRVRGGDNASIDMGANGGAATWIQSRNKVSDNLYYPLLINPLGGNIGIGTTDPASFRLNVQSDVNTVPIKGYRATATATSYLLTLNSNIGTGSDVTKFRVEADGDVISSTNSYTSDSRAKTEVSDLSHGTNTINQLQPKQFKMIGSEEKGFKYGFIAQEIETTLPDLVREDGIDDGEGGSYKALDYNSIIAVLTKAVQEQQQTIKSLEQRLQTLENK